MRRPVSPVPCCPPVRTIRSSPSTVSSSTGRTSVKPSPRKRSASGGWQSTGTSLGSRRRAVSSKWSPCRWVTRTASRRSTRASAGSGSSTSGVGRGWGVFGTAGRAPCGSSCGSTRMRSPAARSSSVALRTSVRCMRSAPYRHNIRPSRSYRGGTLGGVRGSLICVIEDEEVIAGAVAARLRAEGFSVELAHDGPAGVALCDRVRPDLVVLDLMLPGLDGLEVCRRIQRDRQVPVLMLTARAEEEDLLVGLAVGADDYVVKPFSPRELVARVRALLRRVERRPAPPGELLRLGGLEIDPAARRVRLGGAEVHLTPTEFDLLALLAGRPGVVFSREQLLAEVWGWRDGSGQRTVDSHVRGLRRKLGSELVRTVHGIGYALEAPR